MSFFCSFLSVADVLTITASVISFVSASPVTTSVMYVRVLRLMRIIRVLRALRLFRFGDETMLVGGLRNIILNICSTIAVVWLVSACLLQYIEWADQAPGEDAPMMDWHMYAYYMLIEVLGRPRIPVEGAGGWAYWEGEGGITKPPPPTPGGGSGGDITKSPSPSPIRIDAM